MLLLLNNISSVMLVIMCWWLAHSYAAKGERMIGVGFGLVAVSVTATAFTRNYDVFPTYGVPWLIVATKSLMAATLGMLVHRQCKREKLVNHFMHRCPAARTTLDDLKKVPEKVCNRKT